MATHSDLQPSVWQDLTRLLERLPHAILLHGPAGVGKLALAEAFAQLLLCEVASAGEPACGRCEGCRWFVSGSHPDARLLEPEAIARLRPMRAEEEVRKPKDKPSIEIRIDEVRALDDFLQIGAHRGQRRVVILHPAETMNPLAANALLKNLEEPPPGAVFILVSHRPARLLPTIRSRCVALPVPLPETDIAARWLESKGMQEARRWLAFAGGAPLQALGYATEGPGGATDRLLRQLNANDATGLDSGRGREELEALAGVLQRYAMDGALASFGLTPKYQPDHPPSGGGSQVAWLRWARQLGRDRLLARHPMHPQLLAAGMLQGWPTRRRKS